MNDFDWGWIIIGCLVMGNLWLCIGLTTNLLRKLDRLEDKLMAMSEQFPHQAMLELQRKGLEMQQAAMAQPTPNQIPDWMSQEAAG
jgi:hypothetical protein